MCHFAGQTRDRSISSGPPTVRTGQACHVGEQHFNGSTQPGNSTRQAEAVHDFRNILNTVSMLTELAMLTLTEASPVFSMIGQIKAACADASELCNRMLLPPDQKAVNIECLDLSTLVLAMAPQLATFLPVVSSLHFDLVDKSPLKVTSSCEIRQVVMNLVKNAAESLGDRPGSVTVSTGLVELGEPSFDQTLIPQQAKPGQYSYLAVTDTGCGMDEATRSRLFEPFFTTKPHGHGLGTASIQRIVQNNGGVIQVQSHSGNGTQIRVMFPVDPVENPRIPAYMESFHAFEKFCDGVIEQDRLPSNKSTSAHS
jgi:signal transduction histidine kinase